MCRAISLTLSPVESEGATLETYTYQTSEKNFSVMSESVYIDFCLGRCNFGAVLKTDEARVLANQLLQVADTADQHRAARVADDELQSSFDEISQEMQDAEERGGTGRFYSHPDLHYVPADQVESKVRELNAAGVKRFMVLVDPYAEVAA